MLARRLLMVAGGSGSFGPLPSVGAVEMLYNGQDSDGPYQIGAATSDDGVTWTRDAGNPVISPGSSGAWDDAHVKDPLLIHDGTEYIVYYAGSDGTDFRIGRATADALAGPWTKYASNPILDLGSGGSFDDDTVAFPVVLHEPSDTGREWKMWYSAVKAADSKVRIGYAYSSDGLSWTKHGQVLDVGASGQWDDEAVGPAAITKVDSTYYLFYHGQQATSNPRGQVGLVTFTDPEGTYSRDAGNPVILARFNDAGTSQALTADTGAGTDGVTVADTSAFNVGEAVVLADGDSETEVHEIESIDSATEITLAGVTTGDFTMAQNAVFRSFAYNSVGAKTVRREGGQWVMYGTAIQPVEDLTVGGTKLREGVLRFTADDLAGPWSYDYTAGLFFPLYPFNGGWDDRSSEHPSVIAAPSP